MAEKINDLWSVNNDYGFVTRFSDILVSGTTIVGSLFCSRRSVLTDIYKGLDCSAAIMVIGTLLHQLLQTVYKFYCFLIIDRIFIKLNILQVLKKKKFNYNDIKSIVDEIINSSDFVHTLYESDMNLEVTKKELLDFIPKIQNFVKNYLVDFKK